MWIMLIKKLPIQDSPPKMAIMWSTPWPMWKYARAYVREKNAGKGLKRTLPKNWQDEFNDRDTMPGMLGRTPNYLKARKIIYLGRDVRVFPHEFSEVSLENLRLYVFGDSDGEPSHYLQSGTVAEDSLISGALDGVTKPFYEAALLDGANHSQALITALGVDITYPDAEFPPIGWYLCHPEYAKIFCVPSEM